MTLFNVGALKQLIAKLFILCFRRTNFKTTEKFLYIMLIILNHHLTSFRVMEVECAKSPSPHARFSPVDSANVGLVLQTF